MRRSTIPALPVRRSEHLLAVALGLVTIVAQSQAVGAVTDEPGQHYQSQGHCHIGVSCPARADGYEQYPYNSNPPTSGPHEERFPTTFISEAPLPRRILVHILEHGNVVILYNSKASPALVDKLRSYAQGHDFRYWGLQQARSPGADVGEQLEAAQAVFLAPYPDMPYTIALTAWTRLDAFDAYDPKRIDRFVRAWVGNAQNASQ